MQTPDLTDVMLPHESYSCQVCGAIGFRENGAHFYTLEDVEPIRVMELYGLVPKNRA